MTRATQDSSKEKLIADLQKVKEQGKVRTERIKDIIRSAVAEAASEFKEGSQEVRSLVKEAVSAVIDVFQTQGEAVKDEVTASLEGAIEGVTQARRQALNRTQEEAQKLQTEIESAEENLNTQVNSILQEVEETKHNQSDSIKAAIESAVNTIKDSEEMGLMKQRYAQLKAQLAILQANLASRYGERYDEIQHYLDDAKTWYDRAQDPSQGVAAKTEQKRIEFEEKMGKTGTAIARKEKQVKQMLKELFNSLNDVFQSSHK